ncbi:hypothetical protein B7486_05025 [cyanobacterium TDX16]|nr:hypothetical protein B7486_05025 [cyanobacterium TDX16]
MNVRAVMQQMLCTTPSHLRRYPLRYALSVVSISVAVALFVSMRGTQASITAAFRRNVEALAGGAEYRLKASDKLRMADLAAAESVVGVKAAPIVQGAAIIPEDRQTIMVVGLDARRDAALRKLQFAENLTLDLPTLLMRKNAFVAPAGIVELRGWKLGGEVKLSGPSGVTSCHLAGILAAEGPARALGGNIVFMEIGAAQRLLARGDAIDRIDLAFGGGATIEAVRKAVRPECQVESVGGGDPTFEYLYAQFQTILVTVSLIASVIGLFIVYNTMSLSVVQRAKEIGTLRALGSRPREILLVFTLEAALIGLVASIIGAFGGRAIAGEALRGVAKTLSIMMDLGDIRLIIPTDAWLLAPIVGVLAAVVGAFVPARAAANLPPVSAMRPAEVERTLQLRAGLWLACGVVLIALCAVIVRHPRTEWKPTVFGLMAAMIGLALVGPQILIWATPAIRALGARLSSVPMTMALESIVKYPSRTSLTIVALGGSLSLVIAVTALVGGLRREIDRWIDNIFAFDLMIQMNDIATSAYPAGTFSSELLAEVRSDPECRNAYGVRVRLVPFGGDEIMLIAYEPEIFERIKAERGVTTDADTASQSIASFKAGNVAVSRNFARIHGVDEGDVIELPTPQGPRKYKIGAVQTDYSWFRGVVFIDLPLYRETWDDSSLSYVDIQVKDGEAIEPYRAKLTDRWANQYGLFVYRTSNLKENVDAFMRDWFALANLQLLLAVIVGGVGVANTLLVSLLTQTRQIGLLRAIGASTAQIRRMLAGEATMLGLAGGLAGCIIGMATVEYLVLPMSVKATGYDLPIVRPYGAMAYAVAAAILIALTAAILPLRAVKRLDVTTAIGYE